MKKIASFILLLGLLSNCQESKDANSDNQLTAFNRDVGQQISLETAERWIDRFKNQSESAKIQSGQQLSETSVNQILNPTSDKLGIAFHRALDDDGEYHIIVEPIIEGQPAWTSQLLLDANTDALVNVETAERWADNYKSENPNEAWSHFFGMHVFESAFNSIQLVESLDDDNAPALLLYIWRTSANQVGRTSGEMLEVYDRSIVCPPNCDTAI